MKKSFLLIAFLASSVFARSQNDFSIAKSFRQGNANNCASVALIKAAMLKYGYNRIFSYKRSGNYDVDLKDGTKLIISQEELNLASVYSHFDTTGIYRKLGSRRDSVLFYAYMSYACIAKYISEYGYWGCTDDEGESVHIEKIPEFKNALSFITNTSFCTDNCYKLLGLKIKENKIADYTGEAPLNEKGTILYSKAHAVTVYNNQLDCHGQWVPVSAKKVCRNVFKWYIVLE